MKPCARWFVDDTGCWVWHKEPSNRGYAVAYLPVHKDKVYVYTTNYIMKYGPPPKGHQLDHTCKNRRCVNPDHLEAVPQVENLRRGYRTRHSMEIARKVRAEYPEASKVRGGVKRLGMKYGMDRTVVGQIVRNEIWKEGLGKW